MTIANDTFTDSNGTLLDAHESDSGHNWVEHASSFSNSASIQNNRAAGDWGLFALYTIDAVPPTANYRVFVTVIPKATGDSTVGGGLVARHNLNDGYIFRIRSTTMILQKTVSGSTSTLDSVSHSIVFDEQYHIEWTLLGSQLTIFVQRDSDGNWINNSGTWVASKTPVIDLSDNDITGVHNAGIAGRSTVYQFDDFEVEEAGVDLTESVSSSLSLIQDAAPTPVHVPLILLNSRITRLPDGAQIAGSLDDFMSSVFSDLDNATFYFYGGILESDWKINRYLKSDVTTKAVATEASNPSYTNLQDAWDDRTTLNYG